MIKAFLGTAFAGLLLAGCSMPQNTATTTTTAAAAKPKCDKHESATGSHMTGNCDYTNVSVVGGDAVANAMRQNGGSGMRGN
jgi:hypothetical protein